MTNTQNYSNQMKKFFITGLMGMTFELWLFIREFPKAAMLNPSLKRRFISEFSRIKNLATEK